MTITEERPGTAVGPLTSGEVSRRRVEAIVYGPMDDALRNHLVTLAYVDLSNAMAELLGHDDANWCSLAVWPSFTVGATIRSGSEDRIEKLTARLPLPNTWRRRLTGRMLRGKPKGPGPLNRSIAAGNRGVFYEIGLAWSDFIETFGGRERSDEDWAEFERFSDRLMSIPLPPGKVWPDGSREQLRDGFRAYLEALHTDDPARRSQLILLGNMRMGDHEQRRLQGWLDLSMMIMIRDATRPFDDTTTRNRGIAMFERWWVRLLTKRLYVVEMNGETIRVGHPVPPHEDAGGVLFPPPLDELAPDVAAEFDRIDAAAPGGNGAERWNDIDSRMAFIATLFRARQRAGLVGANPYSEAEVAEIMARAVEIDRADARYELEGPLIFADMETMPSPWSNGVETRMKTRLLRARRRGDDEADAAIEAFYAASNRPPEERFYTDPLQAIHRTDESGSGPLNRFLVESPVLPAWADMEQIERAQAFYADYRAAAFLGLFYGSMPVSYAASEGCQVLGLVSTLSGDTVRRFWESARFLEDVFTTPFWEADSEGYHTIRGVRLFHAAVRHTIECGSRHIVDRPPEFGGRTWNDDWGRPINQEDLLGASIDWSAMAIQVMDRFAVALDPDDARAYYHLWMVVGAMLGADPDLMTSPERPSELMTLEEAQYTAQLIFFRQMGPSTAGRRLMDGLMGMIGEALPRPLQRVAIALMYTALNDEVARVLGLPPAGRTEQVMFRLTDWGRTWRGNETYGRAFRGSVRWVGERFMDWWEREYTEVPPYRRGGVEATEGRMPVSLRLTIESYGEIDDVARQLRTIDAVDVLTTTPDDDDMGYESFGVSTIIEATSSVATSLRTTVRMMRDNINAATDIRRAELSIDGRSVPIGQLTDAEIDALFPD